MPASDAAHSHSPSAATSGACAAAAAAIFPRTVIRGDGQGVGPARHSLAKERRWAARDQGVRSGKASMSKIAIDHGHKIITLENPYALNACI